MRHFTTHMSFIIVIIFWGMASIVPAETISDRHLFSKVVLSHNKLYISDGEGEFPGRNASLIRSTLLLDALSEKWLIPTGIFYYHFPSEQEDAEFTRSVISHYPFNWDIINESLVSLAIKEDVMMKEVGCDFVRMSFEDIENLKHLPRSSPGTSNLPIVGFILLRAMPLERAFQDTKQGQRVFFDFSPSGESTIRLFIASDGALQIWENYASAENKEDLRNNNERKTKLPPRKNDRPYRTILATQHASHSWKQVNSLSIEFDGPFYVIPFSEKTYLFSEYTGTVYQFDEERLVQVLQLPFERETVSDNPFENIFVVDKDREQLTFFVSSFTQSESPTVVTLGGKPSMPQGVGPALRSALELYGVQTE